MSAEELVLNAEFSRWVNSNATETNRRKIYEAGWKAAQMSACRHCFCREGQTACCYCAARRKNGSDRV